MCVCQLLTTFILIYPVLKWLLCIFLLSCTKNTYSKLSENCQKPFLSSKHLFPQLIKTGKTQRGDHSQPWGHTHRWDHSRDRFSYFCSGGVDKYLWGGGVLLLALARAWWQRPERLRP